MSARGRMRHAFVAAVTLFLTAWMTGFATAPAMALATCATLATDPANGLVGDAALKSVSSSIVAANGANKAYCSVHLLYGTNANQNINIVLALPLNAADGGSGGLTGAWNGRTQGLGGGGCAGISGVNGAMLTAMNGGHAAPGPHRRRRGVGRRGVCRRLGRERRDAADDERRLCGMGHRRGSQRRRLRARSVPD